MNEFARIATYFAPLAKEAGAFGLKDDAALIAPASGKQMVITQDTLVESVHFIGNENPALIAQKALRTSLSDLAAKGSNPAYYFLSLSLPSSCGEAWLTQFSAGLKQDQIRYGIALMGGDTTYSPDRLVITITAIGYVKSSKGMVQRSGGKMGDLLYVTGTIGDAYLGLQIAQGKLSHNDYLLKRYQLPEPRTIFAPFLADYATACLDVSDGLLQDLSHICNASEVGAVLQLEKLPLSEAAETFTSDRLALAAGGDDYELLFSASPYAHAKLMRDAGKAGLRLTQIGELTAGSEIKLFDHGERIPLPATLGYQHML